MDQEKHVSRIGHVRIFLSFDVHHDQELGDRLTEESHKPGAGFEITACSQAMPGERTRRQIASADEVIVICGVHTEASAQVSTEIRIAQEEEKPYFLIWGRRELMCTRPLGAKPGDAMYSWTPAILQAQIATTLRNATPREIPESCKRP
jgi:hypothetical protein